MRNLPFPPPRGVYSAGGLILGPSVAVTSGGRIFLVVILLMMFSASCCEIVFGRPGSSKSLEGCDEGSSTTVFVDDVLSWLYCSTSAAAGAASATGSAA